MIENKVRPSVTTVLQAIHNRAPNAKILLMGYPALVEPNNVGCPPFISTDSVNWMDQMSGVLDTQMQAAADDATRAGAPTVFADPHQDFAGKAVCGDPESIHGIVLDRTPGDSTDIVNNPTSAQSFHPKIEGTTLYAETADRAFAILGM